MHSVPYLCETATGRGRNFYMNFIIATMHSSQTTQYKRSPLLQ